MFSQIWLFTFESFNITVLKSKQSSLRVSCIFWMAPYNWVKQIIRSQPNTQYRATIDIVLTSAHVCQKIAKKCFVLKRKFVWIGTNLSRHPRARAQWKLFDVYKNDDKQLFPDHGCQIDKKCRIWIYRCWKRPNVKKINVQILKSSPKIIKTPWPK